MFTTRSIQRATAVARSVVRRDASTLAGKGVPATLSRALAAAGPWKSTAQLHESVWSQHSTRAFSRKRAGDAGKREKVFEPLNIDKIAVIGGGNMADAVITGVLSKNLLASEKIVVSDPNPHKRDKFKARKIGTVDRNAAAVKDADVIVLAVKPQTLEDVLESFAPVMKPDALVLSVVAGATIENIQNTLGEHSRIIRTMPNTPAMIGEGMTVWSQSNEVTEEQHALTRSILGAFGVEVFVDDEGALDMATALSGSGPAYFFLVAEAMIDTGVHMGFSRAVATKLVQQTMLGSALYMQSSDAHPVELRNNITSPGGTTAAALYRAEKNGFRAVIADSIWAAYERCMELGSPVPIMRRRPRS